MVKRRKPVRREHNIGIRVTRDEKKMIKDYARSLKTTITDMIVDLVKSSRG